MIDAQGLGLRDGILLIAGLAAVYLVFMGLRLAQLKKRKAKAAAAKGKQAPRVTAEPAPLEEEDEDQAGMVYSRPRPAPAPLAANSATNPATDPGFAALLGETRQRQQESQSAEVGALRAEIETLRETLATMQDEVERLKAANNVSPLYNEAVGLAQHGIDAEGIAARCGISIAEAQLVAALSSQKAADLATQLSADDGFYGDDYGSEGHHGRTAKRYAAA